MREIVHLLELIIVGALTGVTGYLLGRYGSGEEVKAVRRIFRKTEGAVFEPKTLEDFQKAEHPKQYEDV
jgi:hypothetical protein